MDIDLNRRFQKPVDQIFHWLFWRLSADTRLRFLSELPETLYQRLLRGLPREEGLRIIAGLPFEDRLRVLEKLPEDDRLTTFIRLGGTLGVQSYGCSGLLGFYEGSLSDRAVMAHYLKTGNWESPQQTLLRDYVFNDNRGTYIDVGANIGLTVIPLAKARAVACFAFEPDPRNYEYLRRNIAGNGMERLITAFHSAVFSECGKMELELSETNAGDHRLRRFPPAANKLNALAEESRKVVLVDVQNLDSCLDGNTLDKPIALKIDTQGAEVQVLRGARRLMPRVDHLIIEYWPYGLNRMGDSPAAFFDEIKQFPYGRVSTPYAEEDPSDLAKLKPIESVIDDLKLNWSNGDSDRFADLILARRAALSSG
jgi:FkbM family methyltransferase